MLDCLGGALLYETLRERVRLLGSRHNIDRLNVYRIDSVALKKDCQIKAFVNDLDHDRSTKAFKSVYRTIGMYII
jgi:methyl coenzyme M reductase gamma subunit